MSSVRIIRSQTNPERRLINPAMILDYVDFSKLDNHAPYHFSNEFSTLIKALYMTTAGDIEHAEKYSN